MGGSKCYDNVKWAMDTGVSQHPDWYNGLTEDSPFEDFQLELHKQGKSGCGFPCALTTTTTTTTTTTFPCTDAEPGSECYRAVDWAMNTGIKQHPDWYPGLSPASSFRDFQLSLHKKGDDLCDMPCASAPASVTPTSSPSPLPTFMPGDTPEPTSSPEVLSC